MTARPRHHVGRSLRGLERPTPGGDGPENLPVLLDQDDDPDALAATDLFAAMDTAAARGTSTATPAPEPDPTVNDDRTPRPPFIAREGTGEESSRRGDDDVREAVAELFLD